MRIAAIIVLGICAAATAIVMVERQRLIAKYIPAPSVSMPPSDQLHRPPPPLMAKSHDDRPQVVPAIGPSDDTIASAATASELLLTGHVYFEGMLPVRRPIDLSASPQCLSELRGPIYDDSLGVSEDGTPANVVIWISGGLSPEKKQDLPVPAVLDQQYCMFQPHVLAVMAGQKIIVRDSGHMLHNAHAVDPMNLPVFDFTLAGGEERTVEQIQTPQTLRVNCDLHPWMHAWIKVLDNKFFDVTRGDGAFSIRDLPAGTYRISAWHESLGLQEKQITVSGGEPVVVDFTFQGK
jgi:plastocyanin